MPFILFIYFFTQLTIPNTNKDQIWSRNGQRMAKVNFKERKLVQGIERNAIRRLVILYKNYYLKFLTSNYTNDMNYDKILKMIIYSYITKREKNRQLKVRYRNEIIMAIAKYKRTKKS